MRHCPDGSLNLLILGRQTAEIVLDEEEMDSMQQRRAIHDDDDRDEQANGNTDEMNAEGRTTNGRESLRDGFVRSERELEQRRQERRRSTLRSRQMLFNSVR